MIKSKAIAFFRNITGKLFSFRRTSSKIRSSARSLRNYTKSKLDHASIEILNNALKHLPLEKITYLPLYANRITGHPHAFARQAPLGDWLEKILVKKYESAIPEEEQENYFQSSKTEQRYQRMLRYGLLPDDISNFVTVNSILAYKDTEKPDPNGRQPQKQVP
ncbi:MAG: TIGR02679 domain-containing protein [Peptostreptococcaceae bacterium]|nr:TIGR02679 domain-containing protein [Peptostreptococcaceae bacterium]